MFLTEFTSPYNQYHDSLPLLPVLSQKPDESTPLPRIVFFNLDVSAFQKAELVSLMNCVKQRGGWQVKRSGNCQNLTAVRYTSWRRSRWTVEAICIHRSVKWLVSHPVYFVRKWQNSAVTSMFFCWMIWSTSYQRLYDTERHVKLKYVRFKTRIRTIANRRNVA